MIPEAVHLPMVNAMLNGLSAVLLTTGFLAIRQKRVPVHRACMSAAFVTSVLFLLSYLTYHVVLKHGTTKFAGTGWSRPVYFLILTTHTILAFSVPPLAIVTLSRAVRGRFDRHRAIARWTLPIWLYVSVTGVIVYVMLYVLFPS